MRITVPARSLWNAWLRTRARCPTATRRTSASKTSATACIWSMRASSRMPSTPTISPGRRSTSMTRPANGARTNVRSSSASWRATRAAAESMRDCATVAVARRALHAAAPASASPLDCSASSLEASPRDSRSCLRLDCFTATSARTQASSARLLAAVASRRAVSSSALASATRARANALVSISASNCPAVTSEPRSTSSLRNTAPDMASGVAAAATCTMPPAGSMRPSAATPLAAAAGLAAGSAARPGWVPSSPAANTIVIAAARMHRLDGTDCCKFPP